MESRASRRRANKQKKLEEAAKGAESFQVTKVEEKEGAKEEEKEAVKLAGRTTPEEKSPKVADKDAKEEGKEKEAMNCDGKTAAEAKSAKVVDKDAEEALLERVQKQVEVDRKLEDARRYAKERFEMAAKN